MIDLPLADVFLPEQVSNTGTGAVGSKEDFDLGLVLLD